KIGDIDGSASAGFRSNTLAGRNLNTLTLVTEAKTFEVAETVKVEIAGVEFQQIIGQQFTLEFAADKLKFTGVESGAIDLAAENLGTAQADKGIITLSWHDLEGVSSDKVLFTLVFVASDKGQLSEETIKISSAVTTSEAYTLSGETKRVALEMRHVPVTGQQYALFQNAPNPFSDETTIGFELPEAMEARLTVYDVTGKILKFVEIDGSKGYNEVLIRANDLLESGVMYYQLDTEKFSKTMKMVKVSSSK